MVEQVVRRLCLIMDHGQRLMTRQPGLTLAFRDGVGCDQPNVQMKQVLALYRSLVAYCIQPLPTSVVEQW